MRDVEQILEEIYSTPTHRGTDINKTKFVYEIVGSKAYGEMTYDGVEELVDKFKRYFNEDTVFYDLGSGLGKLVYHIGLKYKPRKSCGIEYSKERYQFAKDTAARVGLSEKEVENISFINQSFLKADISDATVIYSDNIAFPKEVSDKMFARIPEGALVISRRNYANFRMFKESEGVSSMEGSPTTYGHRRMYFTVK